MAEVKAADTKKKGRLKAYLKGVRLELKKVVWPTKKETYKYTLVVLVICALFALFFWLIDTGLLVVLRSVLKISM